MILLLLQDETTEEYSTGMGVGGLSYEDEEDDWLSSDSPDFDPAMERRQKRAADGSSWDDHEARRQAAAADEAKRRAAAADEAMKQLLGEALHYTCPHLHRCACRHPHTQRLSDCM